MQKNFFQPSPNPVSTSHHSARDIISDILFET